MPPQKAPTIGDRLSAKGISWAWYSAGWNKANAGHAPDGFAFHWQPYVYFEKYAPGSAERAASQGQGRSPEGPRGRHAPGRRHLQAAVGRQRQPRRGADPRLGGRRDRDPRGCEEASKQLAAHGDLHHLRRLRRLLRPRAAAEGRSLGAGQPRADPRHLAVGEEGARRSTRRSTRRCRCCASSKPASASSLSPPGQNAANLLPAFDFASQGHRFDTTARLR